MKNQNGFTLIETIIYLALFAMIIGGGMVAAYQIIEASFAAHNHIALQEEANFLIHKIDWVLTGATVINVSSDTLTVTKSISGTATALTLTLSLNKLTLQRNLEPASQLNSGSIKVDALSFAKTTGQNNGPDTITTTFTLSTSQNGRAASQTFFVTHYETY